MTKPAKYRCIECGKSMRNPSTFQLCRRCYGRKVCRGCLQYVADKRSGSYCDECKERARRCKVIRAAGASRLLTPPWIGARIQAYAADVAAGRPIRFLPRDELPRRRMPPRQPKRVRFWNHNKEE